MKRFDLLWKAIAQLRPGFSFAIEGDSLKDLRWLGNSPTSPISQVELDSKIMELEKYESDRSYFYKRAVEYPSLGDQLDDLFKQGIFSPEMTKRIQSIKDKYPKP